MTPAILETLSRDADDNVRYGVAGNHQCPTELLEHLASDESTWVRFCVAANSGAPLEVVRKLARDPEAEVRGRTVSRLIKQEQHDLLELLVRDPDSEVRYCMSQILYNGPTTLQTQLATDPDARIRERIANYDVLDTATLEQLLKDPDPEVRISLACNKVTPTPAAVIEALANDSDPQVRWQAVYNGAISTATLKRLAVHDPVPSVRERAQQ